MKNFLGLDGFVWWIGVVEDNTDSLRLGRLKVRCFGYHPAKIVENRVKIKRDADDLPVLTSKGDSIYLDETGKELSLADITAGKVKTVNENFEPVDKGVPIRDLPWALVVHPLNTPNLYGTPNVGDFVFGFFLDGQNAQEPAVMGYFPAIPSTDPGGFATPSRRYIRRLGDTSSDALEGSLIRDFKLFSEYTRVTDPAFDIANTIIWESRAGRHSHSRHGHFMLFYDSPNNEVVRLQSSADARLMFADTTHENRLTELVSANNRFIVFNDKRKILTEEDKKDWKHIGINESVVISSNNRSWTEASYATGYGHTLTFNDTEDIPSDERLGKTKVQYETRVPLPEDRISYTTVNKNFVENVKKDHYIELKSAGGHQILLYDTKILEPNIYVQDITDAQKLKADSNRYIQITSTRGHIIKLDDAAEELIIQSDTWGELVDYSERTQKHFLALNSKKSDSKAYDVLLQSHRGHNITFNDTTGILTIQSDYSSSLNPVASTNKKHAILLDSKNETVIIESAKGSKITLNKDGHIIIDSVSNTNLIAADTITFKDKTGSYTLKDLAQALDIAKAAFDKANTAFDKAEDAFDKAVEALAAVEDIDIPTGVSISVSAPKATANTPTGTGLFVTSVSVSGTLT